jgi:hypothetical protein
LRGTMGEAARPWERQDGEPEAAYFRFLCYRNLGPGRSLAKAAELYTRQCGGRGAAKKGTRKATSPGRWHVESSRWDWVARARAWDCHVLAEHGIDAVLLFVDAVRNAALKVREALDWLDGPANWKEAMETLRLLGTLIPPETVAGVLAHCRTTVAPEPAVDQAPHKWPDLASVIDDLSLRGVGLVLAKHLLEVLERLQLAQVPVEAVPGHIDAARIEEPLHVFAVTAGADEPERHRTYSLKTSGRCSSRYSGRLTVRSESMACNRLDARISWWSTSPSSVRSPSVRSVASRTAMKSKYAP